MTALDYARRKIIFWQTGPITGKFDDAKYPFIADPLIIASDFTRTNQVQYGPTQSLKTVMLEIAIAYYLDFWRSSVLAVAQSDDDSKSFSQIKLTPFLERILSLVMSLKDGKSAKTIMQWLWANHELIISGPGENAQESKSVRCLCTDEAHRWCVSNPGALSALENRCGGRWDRKLLHATTAADAGTEIDILYHQGNQGEWHQRCIHCNKLFWPLWIEESRAEYNGHEVFQWTECPNEDDTLNSIRVVCPHCNKSISDTFRNRLAMDEGAGYVSKNPTAATMYASFRWNCFAPRWKAWRDLFAIYRKAIASVKLGDLKPYEDWVKKQLVVSWTGQYPQLGDSSRSRKFLSSEVPDNENELRLITCDYQAGLGGEGKHGWALCEQYDKQGNSKRIWYRRFVSFEDVEKWRILSGVKPEHVGIDARHETREVYAACSRFHWMAFMSSDELEFTHIIAKPGKPSLMVNLPYSPARRESSLIGKKQADQLALPNGRYCPPGWAIVRTWSKPTLYGILYKLKSGYGERTWDVPTDIDNQGNDRNGKPYPTFTDQIHSYISSDVEDKATRTVKKTVWVKTKRHDHAFVCAAQGLVIAILSGFFPLALDPAPVLQSTP